MRNGSTAAAARPEREALSACRASLPRWRDPSTDRFVSFDDFEGPAHSPQHLHKYLYTGGNPTNAHDPSGYDFWSATGQMVTAGVQAVLRGLFLPTLSAQTLLFRTVVGGASFGYGQMQMMHYDEPVAKSLERLASVVQSLNPRWSEEISGAAQHIANGLAGKASASAAVSFVISHLTGSQINFIKNATIATDSYLKLLRAENAAMRVLKEWSGLDIRIDVDALSAGYKYLTMQLDPAHDIDLIADAITEVKHGNLLASAKMIQSLATSLSCQYDVTITGAYHGRHLDLWVSASA